MRTTINVRDDLLRRAKKIALHHSSSINQIVDRALAEYLARLEQPSQLAPTDLPRSKQSGGVQPGVDLDDTASLMDILEDRT